MDFFNQMKTTATNNVEYNIKFTENGAVGFDTTGKKLLDLNFTVASLRGASNQVIKDKFIDAYFENPRLAVLWLFYARDIREGLGERRLFRTILDYLMESGELIKLLSEVE